MSNSQIRTKPASKDRNIDAGVMSNYNKSLSESKTVTVDAGTAEIITMINVSKPDAFRVEKLSKFVQIVKNETIANKIQQIRNAKSNAEKNKCKSNLPAIAFGRYTGAPSSKTYVAESRTITIADIDNVPDGKLDSYKASLSSHPSVVCCFISPSGNGLKAFFKTPPIKNNEHSYRSWEQVNRECKKLIPNIDVDPSGKNVSRLCYFSSDADIYVNFDAEELAQDYGQDADADAVVAVPLTEASVKEGVLVEIDPAIEDRVIATATGMCAKASKDDANRHALRLSVGIFIGGCIAGGLIDEVKATDLVEQLSDSIADNGTTSSKELKTLHDAIAKGKDSPIYSLRSDFDNFDDDGLRKIQQAFALYNIGGTIGVIDIGEVLNITSDHNSIGKAVSFYKKEHGALLIARYAKKHNICFDFKKFLLDSNTHMYTHVAFSPEKLPSTTINLWRGYTAVPCFGDASIITDFIKEIICDGDEICYEYLTSYLAHMLQKPEEKPEVCLVMLGGEGIGKGSFFQLVRSIWASSTYQCNDVDQIVGRFNAVLERNYIVCMDEALFAGDGKSIEKFKNLITEPRIPIDEKNEPSRDMDSYHRFMAATNNPVFAKTTSGDRRFCHFRVSEKRKQDHGYFETLKDSFKNEVTLGAFVKQLLERDISKFNVRARPKTQESTNQKKQSLKGFDRFWYEVLKEGTFVLRKRSSAEQVYGSSLHTNCDQFAEGQFITTSDIVTLYTSFDKNSERFGTVSTDSIAKSITALCPSAEIKRKRIDKGNPKNGRQLPSLKIARQEFTKFLNVDSLDWDDDVEELDPDEEDDVF